MLVPSDLKVIRLDVLVHYERVEDGCGTHFILFDYAVRLERFSPSEGDLLLVCASLDGLLRDGAGNCRHKSETQN